jgi:hypothetical protein
MRGAGKTQFFSRESREKVKQAGSCRLPGLPLFLMEQTIEVG